MLKLEEVKIRLKHPGYDVDIIHLENVAAYSLRIAKSKTNIYYIQIGYWRSLGFFYGMSGCDTPIMFMKKYTPVDLKYKAATSLLIEELVG